MKKLEQVNWKEIIIDIVLPHIGTLALYIVLFCVLSFILGVIYNVLLWRKKIYIRQHKYYNWLVKIYIPTTMFVFLYFGIQFAFIFGAKKIIRAEESKVINEIYEVSVTQFFKTPTERKDFILKLQNSCKELKNEGKSISHEVTTYVAQNNTGFKIIDTGKNKLTNYIIKEYETNLYTAILYGVIKASGSTMKIDNIKDLNYSEINLLLEKTNTLDPKQIENSVKTKLTEAVDKIISSKINDIALMSMLIFILFLSIPILEYFIYCWWLKRKLKVQTHNNAINQA